MALYLWIDLAQSSSLPCLLRPCQPTTMKSVLTMRSIQEISQDRSPHRRSTHRVPRRTLKSQWDAETNIWVIWASERNKSTVSPSLSRGRNEEKWWKQNQVSITHMVLPAGLLQINVFLNKQTSAKSSHYVRQEQGSLLLWIQLFDRPARWSRAKTQKWCFLGDSGDLSPISLRYFHDQLNFYSIYGILGNYGIYIATHQNAQAACMLWIILFLQSKHLLRWHKCQPWAYKSAENG